MFKNLEQRNKYLSLLFTVFCLLNNYRLYYSISSQFTNLERYQHNNKMGNAQSRDDI